MKNRLLRFGLLAAAALSIACPLSTRAASLLWTNAGYITTAPQIDAVNFFNSGYIDIFTSLPFETSNTRNFTNSGTMVGSPGWFFHHVPAALGYRTSADNFVNLNTGVIQARDGISGGIVIGTNISTGTRLLAPSYLWVRATNIINRGTLSVGANGWLKLDGANVNLTRSALDVLGIVPTGSSNDYENRVFRPDAGIYDVYWGGTNVAAPPGINSRNIYTEGPFGVIASTPAHDVTRAGGIGLGGGGRNAFSILNPISDSYAATNETISITLTNDTGATETIDIPTNITRQAVFVAVNDTNRQFVSVSWFPSDSPTNYFMAPQVEIATLSTNVVEDVEEMGTLYLMDTLASTTNRGMLANSTAGLNLSSFRPASYVLSRLPIGFMGAEGQGAPTNTFLFEQGVFTNANVAADYSAYSAFVDYLPAELPQIPAGTVTNLPGRVQIYADSLDMRRTRIRGQGEVRIETDNLVTSSNAVIDSPHLSFALRSANNNLQVVNMAKEEVARTKGPIRVWSAVWQNEATLISTNYAAVTNSESGEVTYERADLTNTAVVGLYALIVDATSLRATLPVTVWDFVTESKSVVVDDNMTVVQKFYTEAEDLTLNGRLSLSNAFWTTSFGTTFFTSIPDWTATNAPNLVNFTNNGSFWVYNGAYFGADRPAPYQSFVNRGIIDVVNLSINSSYFLNEGVFAAFGDLIIRGGTGSFDGATMIAGATRITADNLRINNTLLEARDLELSVSGTLADSGVEANNAITVTSGFHLLRRPASGDLLGTTITTALPNWQETVHTWAGEDRGASASGYQNNAALGSLVFSPVGKDPLAYFKGAQSGSALYVDFLDIAEMGENWAEFLEIDPSLTIYYAAVRVGFEPPEIEPGVTQTPEEYLDGKLGGRLRWVRDYAGGLSSVAIVVDGVTVFMNAALRNSTSIDTDEDGVPNYFDSTPLGGESSGALAAITLRPALIAPTTAGAAKSFSLSWDAAPNSVYEVEVATDITLGDWQPFATYTNDSSTTRTALISDPNMLSFGQRFYRVRKK